MPPSALLLSLGLATLSSVSAHVQLWYPEWRGDSFQAPFSQRTYPCAGISDDTTTTRTTWPLDGGSLNFTLHDDAAYIWVNIGLGDNATNFNYTLFAAPLNETGAGNLCFPKLSLPSGMPVADGTHASIQIATAGDNGEGLYNCADIVFSGNTTLLPTNQCVNSSTVAVTPLGYGTSESANSTTSSAAAASSHTTGGAAGLAPSFMLLLLGGAVSCLI